MVENNLPSEIMIPKDEKILLRFRREFSALIIPYIVNVLIGLGAIVVIFSIIEAVLLVYFRLWFLIINALMINFGNYFTLSLIGIIPGLLFVPIIGYFYCRSHVYLITDRRLIIYWKFFFIRIRETKLEKMTDLTVKQGLLGRIFRFGDINPITPGLQAKIPRQSGSSTADAAQTAQTVTFMGFAGVKSPFDITYKFKSIVKFGKII
ncbi:MAG: PH domain-containing protein [Candidatus Helarchaeota archaeon]